MKQAKIIILVCILAICLGGCRMWGAGVNFKVIRINSDSSLLRSESDYYYNVGNFIYHYSLENNEEEMMEFLLEDECMEDFTIWNDTIYYVVQYVVGRKWKIKRFEYTSGMTETLLSWKDVISLYDGDEDEEISSVRVESYGDALLIQIMDRFSRQVYICRIGDNENLEFIDVNDLFPEENKSEKTEEIVYNGIIIERQYDMEREKYTIVRVRDEESGRNIFSNYFEACLEVDGEDVIIWKEDSEFWYREGDDPEEHKIFCLSENECEGSMIFENKLAVENGEIVGLVHAVREFPAQLDYPSQAELRYDVLFRLNPETGESSILYKPENNRTRIVGYQDGIIYLMENYKIYSQPIEDGGKRILLYELPEHTDYRFDWQGDHLLIFYNCFEHHELVTDLLIKQDGN